MQSCVWVGCMKLGEGIACITISFPYDIQKSWSWPALYYYLEGKQEVVHTVPLLTTLRVPVGGLGKRKVE